MLVDLVEVTTSDGLSLGGAYMAATVADRRIGHSNGIVALAPRECNP